LLISIPRHLRVGVVVTLVLAAGGCGDSPTASTPTGLSISAISPSAGSTKGGTAVSISGSGFSSGAIVTIGGVAASLVTVQGGQTITASTPASTGAGAVDVVVTSAGRTATLVRGFTFVAPSGANQAPVIASIRSIGSRTNQPSGFADLDETVSLVATVTDVETPASALTYVWSGPGTFGGSGATVSWRVPATVSPTPSTVVVVLTVTELFTEGGVGHTNTTSRTFVVDVHDSQKEILDMGEDFLTLFSRSEVPSDQVLHNFSTTCDDGAGRRAEKSDVDRNRAEILYTKFSITRVPPVRFNFGGLCLAKLANKADACADFRVHWEFIDKKSGAPGVTDGTDHVTAVYESSRWRLCHSNFSGLATFRTLGITRWVEW
jgi:IPT/TIG domain-containing protein